jgi:hypothetical protein
MRHQSRPAHFQTLFNVFATSLQEYEKQTGIVLSKHALAEQLRSYSDSAESVTIILQEQVPACSEFGGTDRITKSLSSVVSVLYTLSVSVDFYWVRSKMLIGLFHLSCLFYSHSPLRSQYMLRLLSYSLYVSFLHSCVRFP